MFAPPPGPVLPGERGVAHVTVRFGGPGDSRAGRKVRVAVRPPSDVSVEPAESEVTLDSGGSAVVRVYVVPDKVASPGPRTLSITATDSDKLTFTLQADVFVR